MGREETPSAFLPWTVALGALLVAAALAGLLALSLRIGAGGRGENGGASELKSSHMKLLEKRNRELEEREKGLQKKVENYKKMLMKEFEAHSSVVQAKNALITQRDEVIEEFDRALADRIRSVHELRVANEDLQRRIREKEVTLEHAEREIELLREKLREIPTEE